MKGKELIESGLIELYVLGIASTDERTAVETLANRNKSVRDEIASVNDALAACAIDSKLMPPEGLKHRILNEIEKRKDFPPALSPATDVDLWIDYLHQHKISPPSQFSGIYFKELPGSEDFYTYVVWGRNGDFVDEEFHDHHKEFLLICKGECEMIVNGKSSYYKAGDFLEINPNIPHSARVTGNELMLVIGQRQAA